jgi:hypothetical protein
MLNWRQITKAIHTSTEPVFVNLLRSPRIDSQSGEPLYTTTLFVVPARQASGIDSSESIPGLHKRLQIRLSVGKAVDRMYAYTPTPVTSKYYQFTYSTYIQLIGTGLPVAWGLNGQGRLYGQEFLKRQQEQCL